MSAYEFSLWAEMYRNDPWGDERADIRNAILAANIVNMSGKSLRSGDKVKVEDFLPFARRSDVVIDSDPMEFFKAL